MLNLLDINDVTLVHARCEDYVKDEREKFDVAVSRAVAQIPTLSEYLLPFVKVGGEVMMYKGNKLQEELSLGKKAISLLGGSEDKILNFDLAEIESQRFILIVKKIQKTNLKYPRNKNLPKTQPLL